MNGRVPLLQGPKTMFGSFCYTFNYVSGALGILGVNLIVWVLLIDPYLVASRGPKPPSVGFLLSIRWFKRGPWCLGVSLIVWVLLLGPCLYAGGPSIRCF